MEFTIYSLGNVDFLAQIMNSVAMICGTGNYTRLISVGFLIGLLFICFQSVFQGAQRINLQQTLVCFIVYLCMFGPSCTVLIEDVYKGQVRNVDNVPLGVGVSGMAISNIGYGLTKMMEQAFSDVDRTTEHGFGESLRILNELRVLNTDKDQMWMVIDRDLGNWGQGQSDSQKAVRNYLSECLFVDVALGRIQSPSVLASTPWSDAEVWQSRSDAHAVYLPVTGTNQTTGIVSCSRAYDLLDRTVMRRLGANVFQDWLDERLGGVQSPDATQPATQAALTSMGLAQDKVQDFMQSLAINTIYDEAVADFYLTYHDQVSAAAVRQAQIQRNTQWASEGTMFLAAARALMAFFEGFIYAITPIVGFLIVTGAFGLGLVGKFLLLIVWIQLWLPILSITNLYINIGARSAVSASLGADPSMYTINEMWAQTATWVSTGGMMAAATPMIALFLITGSTYAFTTLTNRLGGQDHFNERATSPDAITTGAVMARTAAYNANRTQGVVQTGAESEMKRISLNKAFQANESEALNKMEGYRKEFTASLINNAQSGSLDSFLKSASKEDSQAIQSALKNQDAAMKAKSTSYGKDAGDQASNTVTDKTAIETRLGGGFESSLSKNLGFNDKVGQSKDETQTFGKRIQSGSGIKLSGGITASGGSVHETAQGQSGGKKLNISKQANTSESTSNELTEAVGAAVRNANTDALSKFYNEFKGTAAGEAAGKLLSAMRSYQSARQATQSYGVNASFSMSTITNNMSEQGYSTLGQYMRINHADKAQEITALGHKYSAIYGFDGERGIAAAQIDYLSQSNNKQDLAFLGRLLNNNNMPISTQDVSKMVPNKSSFSYRDLEKNFAETNNKANNAISSIRVNNEAREEQLKDISFKEGEEHVRKWNESDKAEVQNASIRYESYAKSEAQQKALQGLDNAPIYSELEQAKILVSDLPAQVALKRLGGDLFNTANNSPTEKQDLLLGGEHRQTLTGFTQAQKEVADQWGNNYYANPSDAKVKAEIKHAIWGDKQLNEEEMKALDYHTDRMMEHLKVAGRTGRQAAALPVTEFNLAWGLRNTEGQY